jgi:hydrogenase expression/formation protein HypD
MVYSPLDAVQLAARLPDREVVFLAVGFETTAPATALAVLQAERLGLTNFRVLAHHVRVEPGMRAILEQPDCRVQGFLAAGHVCTVAGFAKYDRLAQEFDTPIVVTGFEPIDLLAGLMRCVELLETGRAELHNAYARCAREDGNPAAQRLIEHVFQVDTLAWRGFGAIHNGGLSLRPEFRQFDARRRLLRSSLNQSDDAECRSGDVLSGLIKPPACPLFGSVCTPDRPRGAPMVSSEGACAAYFRYGAAAEVTRG